MEQHVDSVLFDLDGTLWDAVPVIFRVIQDLFRDYPSVPAADTTLDDIYHYMGLQTWDILKLCFPGAEDEAVQKIMDDYCSRLHPYLKQGGAVLYDGVEETLHTLSERYQLFLVSNCDAEYLEGFWDLFNLKSYFTGWICAGGTGRPKDENIRIVQKQYGLQHPVYVGDTNKDREAAEKTNVPFIHAAYGFGKDVPAVHRISKITELPDYLQTSSIF